MKNIQAKAKELIQEIGFMVDFIEKDYINDGIFEEYNSNINRLEAEFQEALDEYRAENY